MEILPSLAGHLYPYPPHLLVKDYMLNISQAKQCSSDIEILYPCKHDYDILAVFVACMSDQPHATLLAFLPRFLSTSVSCQWIKNDHSWPVCAFHLSKKGFSLGWYRWQAGAGWWKLWVWWSVRLLMCYSHAYPQQTFISNRKLLLHRLTNPALLIGDSCGRSVWTS